MKRPRIDKRTLLSLYEKMLLIRLTEERIAEIYPDGEIRTPTHFSIGQEAVSAGVCQMLNRSDACFASHRCHAAYLAKGGGLNKMIAELFGRKSGVCGGRSGSAHLSSPEHNVFAAPILGAMIPAAAGAALAFSLDNKKSVAAAFFGDAAIEEGVFFETLNFAIIKKLPMLFICENNFFSTHTHIKYRQPNIPIYKRIGAMGIASAEVDGMKVEDVYTAAKERVEKIRKGSGPQFLECVTYRYREHVGPLYDFNNPYRTKKEVEKWMALCPVCRFEKELLRSGTLSNGSEKKLRAVIMNKVNGAIESARKSPWPSEGELLDNVY